MNWRHAGIEICKELVSSYSMISSRTAHALIQLHTNVGIGSIIAETLAKGAVGLVV